MDYLRFYIHLPLQLCASVSLSILFDVGSSKLEGGSSVFFIYLSVSPILPFSDSFFTNKAPVLRCLQNRFSGRAAGSPH